MGKTFEENVSLFSPNALVVYSDGAVTSGNAEVL